MSPGAEAASRASEAFLALGERASTRGSGDAAWIPASSGAPGAPSARPEEKPGLSDKGKGHDPKLRRCSFLSSGKPREEAKGRATGWGDG